MGNKFNQWQDREVELLRSLYMAKNPLNVIYSHFPHYECSRVYNKLTKLFPSEFRTFTTRAERNFDNEYKYGEQADPMVGDGLINAISHFGSIVTKNKDGIKIVVGSRLVRDVDGIYYLDGKKILIGNLIRASKE